jgi:hypothetical protein
MRPPEQDVTFVFDLLECHATEDAGGDEPYMWILGFKVDADTIGPPQAGSLLPTLGVKVIEGMPASPYLLGTGSVDAPATIPVPAALGTRSFRLKPSLLITGDWFSGLAGVICLLWDQDAFSPGTAEAGFVAFKNAIGPGLSAELTNLINGSYDAQLSQDETGRVVSTPGPDQLPLQWRLDRLDNPAARKNVARSITDNLVDQVTSTVRAAVLSAAGIDELLDRDDRLGVGTQIFLGKELSSSVRDFSMRFENGADYTLRGHVTGNRIHLARLNSAVISADKTLDGMITLMASVCWFPPRTYSALAFKVKTALRLELLNNGAGAPVEIRWFLDDKPLLGSVGSVAVTFESADGYFGPPQNVLADRYPGGENPLAYQAAGSVLQISNQGGEGVYFGTVTVLYAYAGDPTIFPSTDLPLAKLRKQCYELSAEVSIIAVDLTMDSAYRDDVRQCKRVNDEIDRKHIAVDYGKALVDPGDPPHDRQAVLAHVTAELRVANAVGLRQAEAPQ